MALPIRLALIGNLVPPDAVLYDIGADRGLFSMAFSQKGYKVYAGENKKGPYQSLVFSLNENRSSVLPLFSDGITVLPEDVDTLVILGMGGGTIEHILSAYPEKMKQIKTLILEPQSQTDLSVLAAHRLGFINDAGFYVLEKRYYPAMRFVRGKEKLSDMEIAFGPYPFRNKDPLLIESLRKKALLIASRRGKGLPVSNKDLFEEEALRKISD